MCVSIMTTLYHFSRHLDKTEIRTVYFINVLSGIHDVSYFFIFLFLGGGKE